MTTPALPEITRPLSLSHGLIFVTEFSATGGVKYSRIGESETIERDDDTRTDKYETRKDIDHVGLVTWSKKIVNQAYGIMERLASQTPVGYWVSHENATSLLTEIADCQRQAKNLNKHASDVGSARRCRIEVFCLQVGQESLESVAIRLAQTTRERLERLRDDLTAGDLNRYASSWKLAKNLPKLSTGIQSDAVYLGLEAAKEARAELAEAIRNKQDPAKAGANLNLEALDSAIVLFNTSVMGCVSDPACDSE